MRILKRKCPMASGTPTGSTAVPNDPILAHCGSPMESTAPRPLSFRLRSRGRTRNGRG